MKKKILDLIKKLGFEDKFKDNSLTSEDWKKFAAEFEKKEGTSLMEALKEAKKEPLIGEEQQQAIIELLNVSAEEEPTDPPKKKTTARVEKPTDTNVADEIKKMQKTMKDQSDKIKKLEADPEEKGGDKVKVARPKTIALAGIGHSNEHLFGIPADMYLVSKPWNEVTLKGAARDTWSRTEITAFQEAFDQYGEGIAKRIGALHKQGLLGVLRTEKGLASIDYSGFDDTGWGEEYVIRRQDALISYIRSLPTVATIFPVRFGVQHKMAMTNSFLTDFSQAYQSGHVFKGGYTLVPELAEVNDAMFKHKFENLKTLEKEYVGYLNREGADPIKWNFIEWLMIETLKKLHNEQEARRVRGARVEPVTGTAGHHLLASTGVIRRIQKYVDDLKLWPFTDLNMYTSSTMLTYMETLVEYVNLILPSMQGYRLYMNEKHVPWFLALYRTKYGTDQDFRGGELNMKNYGLDGITGVPNMGNSCLMWITRPGNLELYEDLPGEMEKLYFQRDLENLIVASWWKEGSGGYMTGKQFTTQALLEADKRNHQFIFLNDPTTALAADAATADGSVNSRFKTINNTGATAFTEITNPEEGVVYRITCGGTTNATTIAKALLFSEITAAWTPTAVGDYLEVYYDATATKFKEVARVVTA